MCAWKIAPCLPSMRMTSTASHCCQKRWLRSQLAPISSPTASRRRNSVRGLYTTKFGMHLQRDLVNSVIAGELGRLLPIWNHSFLPLPVEHLTVLGRPAVSDPVGHRLRGTAARTTGETYDHTHSETLSQQHGAPECLRIALRDLWIRRYRVAVATERRHLNIAVFEFLFPGRAFAGSSSKSFTGQ